MRRMRCAGTIGTVALATLAGAAGAPAATIDVAAGDSAALVAAINTANANGQADTIRISGRYALGTPDNHWYGANVLPTIASDITIVGDSASGATIEGTNGLRGRLFYVSGGRSGLSAGTLRLRDLELRGGRARGGDALFGGGGAGMGGAIFNQGTVDLQRVTLAGNSATGGSAATVNSTSGGGMGQDAQASGGGGFGGPVSGGGAGGAAPALNAGGGGGGGGYEAGEAGSPGGSPVGGAGGGVPNGQGGAAADGTLGGRGTGAGGRAVSNGGPGGAGGAFGVGGAHAVQSSSTVNVGGGGGGGVGGGGGGAGPGAGAGGGGFGGGGGWANIDSGDGGFGGGAGGVDGRNVNPKIPVGGFGGGDATTPPADTIAVGGGGAGMGGAVFNDGGTVTATNSTFTANTVTGGLSTAVFVGSAGVASGGGDGLGSALFNLNGTVTLSHVTIAGNTAAGGTGAPNGTAGTALANVAYDRATARTSSVSVLWSAIDGTPQGVTPTATADGGTNLSTQLTVLTSTTVGGTLDLAPLGDYGGPTATMAPAPGSPLIDAGGGVDTTAEDQRGLPRSGTPDRGAVEAVPTVLTLVDRTIPWSASAQDVALATVVSPARGATSPGAVTFGITGVSGSIAPAIDGGVASGTFSVPGGTAPGTYPITASAAAAPGFRAATGSGTLRILKPPPVCSGVPADAAYETAVTVDPNCTGTETGDTAAIVGTPANGTATVVSGRLRYAPDAGYFGPDSFTYTVTNEGGASNTATVSVTVAPAEPDCAALDVDAGSGKPTAVTLACTSAVAQVYTVVDGPEHGTLSGLDPATGEVTYTSNSGYDGPDSFTYRSTNAGGTSNTAMIDIDVHAAPTVTVTRSPDVELGAGSLTASAAVVGRYEPDADATVDFRLYGPDDATCNAAPVHERLGVAYPAAGGAVEAGAFAPTVAGVYRWRVTYSGDLRNVAADSACDAAPVTVTARPVVPPVEDPQPPVEDPKPPVEDPQPPVEQPAPPPVVEQPVVEQCGAELVLLDVASTKGRKARVSGVARPALAGQRVTILRNGRSVGTTRIRANGSWSATVSGPDSARSRPWYAATTSRTRTGSLRYFRRMSIESRRGLRATGRITTSARLRPQTVRIDRIDVCSGRRTSTTARVSRTGAFTVRLARPAANEPYALFRVSATLANRSQTYTTLLAVAR